MNSSKQKKPRGKFDFEVFFAIITFLVILYALAEIIFR